MKAERVRELAKELEKFSNECKAEPEFRISDWFSRQSHYFAGELLGLAASLDPPKTKKTVPLFELEKFKGVFEHWVKYFDMTDNREAKEAFKILLDYLNGYLRSQE